MRNTLLIITVSIGLSGCGSLDRSAQDVSKNYNCESRVSQMTIDDLPLKITSSDYGGLIVLDGEKKWEKSLKNGVTKIIETHYSKSERFDEGALDENYTTTYQFNKFQNIVENHSVPKNTTAGDDTYLFVYDESGNLTKDIFRRKGDFSWETEYLYDESGRLLHSGVLSSGGIQHQFKIGNPLWTTRNSYEYNENGQLIKLRDVKCFSSDSVVLKYNYDTALKNIPFEVIKYNRFGQRDMRSEFHFNNQTNIFTIATKNVWMTSNNYEDKYGDSRVLIYFDSNCQMQKVTKVEFRDKTSCRYQKIEFNDHGDIKSYETFIYPILKSGLNNYEYVKQLDYSLIKESEFLNYEYVYDNYGNWIERKSYSEVVKRLITYK